MKAPNTMLRLAFNQKPVTAVCMSTPGKGMNMFSSLRLKVISTLSWVSSCSLHFSVRKVKISRLLNDGGLVGAIH